MIITITTGNKYQTTLEDINIQVDKEKHEILNQNLCKQISQALYLKL